MQCFPIYERALLFEGFLASTVCYLVRTTRRWRW